MEHEPLQGIIIRDMVGTDHSAVIDLIWHLNCFEDELTGDRATDYGAASGSLANDIARGCSRLAASSWWPKATCRWSVISAARSRRAACS
jgi:hypothetical protein